jgi:hypothetical protein
MAEAEAEAEAPEQLLGPGTAPAIRGAVVVVVQRSGECVSPLRQAPPIPLQSAQAGQAEQVVHRAVMGRQARLAATQHSEQLWPFSVEPVLARALHHP